eukprot:CAMPEP_0185189430 /NCGR_PEP_ID=MMETSP1140-20130426/6032_1 /TAXON_ID=298111 /ORGANISM="Pavlova sp., Strain CCMP459" /LENGTH=76 /DNA_ID=CAMNT_0027755991 /DNA_START=301 /DNA_END=532 /DNA_ORIENTATION=+
MREDQGGLLSLLGDECADVHCASRDVHNRFPPPGDLVSLIDSTTAVHERAFVPPADTVWRSSPGAAPVPLAPDLSG